MNEHAPTTPLILRASHGQEYVYPQERNVIRMANGETLRLSCINKNFKNIASDTPIDVKCLAHDLVEVDVTMMLFFTGTQTMNISDLECEDFPESHIKRTGVTCHNLGSEVIDVGYSVDKCFIKLLSVCYDKIHEVPLYTWYDLSMLHLGHQPGIEEGKMQTDGMDEVPFDRVYDWRYQRKLLSKVLQSSELANKYVKPDGLHVLMNVLLTPSKDFVYGSQQVAAYRYVNSAPMWASVRDGNWKTVEMLVRDVLAYGKKQR